ncbi:hypothetical protein KEN51_CDS0109 [Pseudomonas phage vB_Pae10145-KEN51]|uniref:PHIKZ258 n=8 Tax=root TaxID=1 RepID=Q8SCQ4_BPDPK|nr:hypothetical protein [Pseudomonas aeruginosa]NP_803824.1 PHIKZ258 [Pseudomonas phage phiKZ]YP_009617387.1 hypothetical protein FDI90_gp099 [Pseudomonas phage PA7]YP_009619608.1 hypothetical protein FDJ06_gp068 [Pseudomonas phage SL2]ANM45070.1 hypothetical protein KTN4_312 [Pseudomonas phage KTN4]QJB22945.1 hypothetical protein fnug_302 [Pseudomonas phage fnug]QOV08157.1 hypothetical protein [Pseudomonas phage vB_PaeM_kmuB]QYV98956.1 hypothetical protein [Pseudomonas phage T2P]QYV99468.1
MIYFEGDGNVKPVTQEQVKELFISSVVNMRDNAINNSKLDQFTEPADRDRAVADSVITGMLDILDGNNDDCPAFHLIPAVGEEEYLAAVEAGADYIPYDDGSDNYQPLDLAGELRDYFIFVNRG